LQAFAAAGYCTSIAAKFKTNVIYVARFCR